jgi:hypothetical protein
LAPERILVIDARSEKIKKTLVITTMNPDERFLGVETGRSR